MTESRKFVLKQTLLVLAGEAVGIAVMFAVYAMLHKFSLTVLLSGVVGALLSAGNFFFLAMAATLAADKAEQQDVAGGKKLMQSSYPIRILVLAGILILCGKSGYFDIVALVVPLLFVRPVLTVAEFFKKKGM